MDVGLVNMGADDKGMVSLGKPHCQLIAQAVGLLRRDLTGNKGLPDGVGNHIVPSAPSAGLGKILPLGKSKLRIGNPAVALIAADEPAVVGLCGIFNIVYDVTDRFTDRPAFAGMQRCYSSGGDPMSLLPRGTRPTLCRPGSSSWFYDSWH